MENKKTDLEVKRNKILDQLIGMPRLLNYPQINQLGADYPTAFVHHIARFELQRLRDTILTADKNTLDIIDTEPSLLADTIAHHIKIKLKQSVAPAINAAGIILHTALGRAPLCQEAQQAIATAIQNYCTLAIDRDTGKRGDRYAHIEELLCFLTGAEAALVVNNNAGATLLALNTLASDKEVIISRGQLIEIGGSFRIPDVMKRSGARMKEVGTTNKTHLRDYQDAITEETALILRVHTSNYQIIGFSSEVPLRDLVKLGQDKNLIVLDDIGSGCLIDFRKYGLPDEPMVQDSVKTGSNIITFSGDKILSGPQCGIIIGKKRYIDLIKKNPLTRALRCDKLTYAALEATLKLYLDVETLPEKHPVLKMLTLSVKKLANRARTFQRHVKASLEKKCEIEVVNGFSQMGSGSLPAQDIPTKLISLRPQTMSAESLSALLRAYEPPIFSRIVKDELLLDFRTIKENEIKTVEKAIQKIFSSP
ncbi:MAG: L-seryl-tRNA(Sec) selenium transferase [Caldithrix sp. RBG_13_44_9]|nr:MAG: L-seryl-tRNA(Sec) selenium transferase [Caldithrix sp. RBG_13_44_9]